MLFLDQPFDPAKVLHDHNLMVALNLARRGAFVFPCTHTKKPQERCFWRSESTRDENQIHKMWAKWPNSVPGVDMGKTGGLVVDCDRKLSDGLAWLTQHVAELGVSLNSPTVDTPSGGRHHVFRNPLKLTNARGRLPAKIEADIDIRGNGGYVVGPGSLVPAGEYVEHGDFLDPPDAPEWLVELLAPHARPKAISFTVSQVPADDVRFAAYGEVALMEEFNDLASKQPGERNEEANRIAFRIGQLVGGGCLTHQAAYSALEAAALSWGISPKDKALGPKGTIARALRAGEPHPRGPDDSLGPLVEINLELGEQFDPETGELPPLPLGELPEHLTHVPGLVGQLTDWITDTALYPQRCLSLGAALTIVGTAAGRHIAGPTRSGTHLYVVCLAPSGAGKDHPLAAIALVLDAAGMRQHIGPSQFISMPAVIRFLQRVPLSVCAMDEFGSFLKRINSRKASSFEGAISGMLRTAWGCSFKAMATPEWAQQASETIFSPALSIYGAVTAPDFYSSLEGGDVTNGVLNRFLIIETKHEPVERVPLFDSGEVPKAISEALKRIYHRNPLSQLCQSTVAPAYDRLSISPEAEQIRRSLVKEIRAKGQADRTLAPFLARTAENAIRLATIATVGQFSQEIDQETMVWARDFALWSTETLAHGGGLYIADSDTQAAANAVRRAITERGGRVRRRDLLRALAHRYRHKDLEDVIKSLAEAEHILIEKVMPAEQGGRPAFFYSIPV
jgi:hypothetical protein